MAIIRYGVDDNVGTGGQRLPFAKAVEAGGWLYISGQTPMRDGEVVEGGIIEQSELAIQNCIDIMQLAGYSLEDVVHVKVYLTDARERFAAAPPARICAVADLVVDCKVEVDITCYRDDRR